MLGIPVTIKCCCSLVSLNLLSPVSRLGLDDLHKMMSNPNHSQKFVFLSILSSVRYQNSTGRCHGDTILGWWCEKSGQIFP